MTYIIPYIRDAVDGSEREYHDSYVERLQKFIREVKSNREMKEHFMVFEEMLRDERAEGRAEGIAEGRAEGLALRLENAKSTFTFVFEKSWNGSGVAV